MTVPLQYYAAGTVIFKEGDPPGMVYLVKSGKVQLLKGQGALLAEVGANGIFGEMAIIDKSPRSATAIALESTYCYQVSAFKFEDRLESSDPFVRGLFRILVLRLRDTTAKLNELETANNRPTTGAGGN